MTGVIDRLEEWRSANGLKKTDMAELLGCNSRQQYGNWVARNSLPKEYFRKAAHILGDTPNAIAPEGKKVQTAIFNDSFFALLSEDDRLAVMRQVVPSLSESGKVEVFKLLTQKK